MDWIYNRRMLESVGNFPPAEYELMGYRQLGESSGLA
jgi:hypothetical protein